MNFMSHSLASYIITFRVSVIRALLPPFNVLVPAMFYGFHLILHVRNTYCAVRVKNKKTGYQIRKLKIKFLHIKKKAPNIKKIAHDIILKAPNIM